MTPCPRCGNALYVDSDADTGFCTSHGTVYIGPKPLDLPVKYSKHETADTYTRARERRERLRVQGFMYAARRGRRNG